MYTFLPRYINKPLNCSYLSVLMVIGIFHSSQEVGKYTIPVHLSSQNYDWLTIKNKI